MHNKKNIAKGLIISILLFNTPIDSMANIMENYKPTVIDNKEKDNIFEEFFDNLFNKFKKSKETIKINKDIKVGTVYEVSIGDNQFIPNLAGNPNGYETIRVTTTGNKKLVQQDYNNLRASGIPRIDLSNAKSDEIPPAAFSEANHLTDFKLPNGITTIGYNAFWKCSGLSGTLTIPDTVTKIDNGAFWGCNKLNGNLIIPNSVITIGNNAFTDCNGFTGDLIIPNSVTSIGYAAFWGCSGFDGTLTIPNSVTNLGDNAFTDCNGFTGDLIIPNSITRIGVSVFYECRGFTGDLVIPDSITEIGDNAFWGCSGLNGTLTIPDSVTRIGTNAFYRCSGFTGDLIIPDSVTNLESNVFWGCSGFNGRLVIPNSITTIKSNTFTDCSGFTGKLIIPESITSIGASAFYKCSGFTGELIIPESVTEIGANAFYNCSGLTGNLVIPNSINSIGATAFQGCNNLSKIFIKISSLDEDTNYKKGMIDNLPDNLNTIIDTPYDLDISNTWLENTNKTVGKPIIKSIVDDTEHEAVDNKGDIISLYIPSLYQENNVSVLRNDNKFDLPTKNPEGKHIFKKSGIYKVTITTDLGNTSTVTFEVEDVELKNAEKAVEKAEESKDPIDIEIARDLVNKLPESIKKDDFHNRLDTVSPNVEFETKNSTANFDIYIKSENILSLSLNTNLVTFEDFSGVEDDEKLNAITLTINSSLPYKINAYLPTEITGSKYGESMNKEIFNIRANNEGDYKKFSTIETPLILLDNQEAGKNKEHDIDLMLKGNIAHKKDIYKTTVKFEVVQK